MLLRRSGVLGAALAEAISLVCCVRDDLWLGNLDTGSSIRAQKTGSRPPRMSGPHLPSNSAPGCHSSTCSRGAVGNTPKRTPAELARRRICYR